MNKKLLFTLPILLILIILTKHSFKKEVPVLPKEIVIQPAVTVKQLIHVKGVQYGVSEPLMQEIINCESGGSTTIQSQHRYTSNRYGPVGSQELSFGPVQIHLPAHPNITKEQATDPEFAVDFLAKNLKVGNGRIWSCYPIALKKIKVDNKYK